VSDIPLRRAAAVIIDKGAENPLRSTHLTEQSSSLVIPQVDAFKSRRMSLIHGLNVLDQLHAAGRSVRDSIERDADDDEELEDQVADNQRSSISDELSNDAAHQPLHLPEGDALKTRWTAFRQGLSEIEPHSAPNESIDEIQSDNEGEEEESSLDSLDSFDLGDGAIDNEVDVTIGEGHSAFESVSDALTTRRIAFRQGLSGIESHSASNESIDENRRVQCDNEEEEKKKEKESSLDLAEHTSK
jgi:hypothetical protein